MGAVDLGSGSGRRVKKGSSIKKPKRLGFVLDMTPLVDIAFLLLTFFMFATTMAQPQVMEMKIPPDILSDVQVEASKLLTLYVGKEEKLYYRVGTDTVFQPLELAKLRDFSVAKNAEMQNDRIMSLKLHPNADYGTMVAVLDELNKAETILTNLYQKEKVAGGERKRKFSIQQLDSLEQYRLEQQP